MSTGLSVVVACHNVAEFLPACLDSLLGQTMPADQVILVDDGSTDETPAICADYAAEHPGWIVVTGPGSGPGGARNLGVAEVSGEYLAFVDGDDVIPPQGYEFLLKTLRQTGSDFAVGDAVRYDGTRLSPSGPHKRAISTTKLRTSIRRTASLIYDTTAWNKVFRTQFWRDSGLSFQADVMYEDIPVMVAAHMAATSVDVINVPVYWWRRRIDSDASITQRRAELMNLTARMDAIELIDAMVAEDELLKRRHDEKVLTFDLLLFMPFFAAADAEYQQTFLERVGAFVGGVSPLVLEALPPKERLRYWLIQHQRGADLSTFLEWDKNPSAKRINIVGPGETLADMPLLGDPEIPRDVFTWGRAHPVVTGIDDITTTNQGLVVTGFAYLDFVDSGDSETRKLSIRWQADGEPVSVPVKWLQRPDLTAQEQHVAVSYDNTGLTFTAPWTDIPEGEWARCLVYVAAPGGRRRVVLSGPFDGRAWLPIRTLLPDGRLLVLRWRDDQLGVATHRPGTLVSAISAVDGDLRLNLTEHRASVVVRRRDSVADRTFPPAQMRLSELDPDSGRGQVDFDVLVDDQPLFVAPGVEEFHVEYDGLEYWVRPSVTGALLISRRAPRPRLTTIKPKRKVLHLSGTAPTGMTELVLENRTGQQVKYATTVRGNAWSVELPYEDGRETMGIRHLVMGRWNLLTQDGIPVHVVERTRAAITPATAFERSGVQLQVRARRSATAYLNVDPSGRIRPPGLLGREQLIADYYPARRGKRLINAILFENWKGKQYSDSTRAIHEELERRRDRRRRIWVVRNHGIRVPKGVETVLRFSPEYYDLLARAKFVVANDAIDGSFVKRDGQTYLQTWHGTPLKKVGFDIDTVNFANKRYLEGFAAEVAKWDYLVSPNAYSSEILGRAFRVDHGLLETGYPRNDIFYRPERAARAAEVRRRLGLRPDQKVVLYAPTWRDDQYDENGRYQFALKLNLDALRDVLGQTHVVLLRGHHLLANRAGIEAGGGFVLNVSSYPDIADLYLIADVLITDYSSVMFDFANTDRPMIFFTWDLDDYRDRVRGMYFDLTEDPPGPICRTSAEVLEALADPVGTEQEFGAARQRFRQRFCAWEDGRAAARVVDAVFQK